MTRGKTRIWKNVLVTGSNSGLGKYLVGETDAKGFTRETNIKLLKKQKFDAIIHCAYNRTRNIDSTTLYKYTYDNVLLTHELTKLRHKKFIFISSVDVYPKDTEKHFEDEVIEINEIDNFYGITKLMSEQIVVNNCENYLILRPTALLGLDMKPNSLTKMIDGDDEKFTLAEDSFLNYVPYMYVFRVLKLALMKDLQGIINVATRENLNLWQIAEILEMSVFSFGEYSYDIGEVSTSKLTDLLPFFNQSTKTIIKHFMEEYRDYRRGL